MDFFFGTAGAIIDGFKPTSWLTRKLIQSEIDNFNTSKHAIVTASNFLRNIDYPKLAYDIFRPEISEQALVDKPRYLRNRLALGTGIGIMCYLGDAVAAIGLRGVNKLDQLIGFPRRSNFLDDALNTVMNHPLETVAVGAALGLGYAAYKLAFHRPIQDDLGNFDNRLS